MRVRARACVCVCVCVCRFAVASPRLVRGIICCQVLPRGRKSNFAASMRLRGFVMEGGITRERERERKREREREREREVTLTLLHTHTPRKFSRQKHERARSSHTPVANLCFQKTRGPAEQQSKVNYLWIVAALQQRFALCTRRSHPTFSIALYRLYLNVLLSTLTQSLYHSIATAKIRNVFISKRLGEETIRKWYKSYQGKTLSSLGKRK